MKKILLTALLLLLPFAASAESNNKLKRPYWSLELKGGRFIPEIDNWAAFYGSRESREFGGSLAYKVLRQVEAGIEGVFSRDTGQGLAPGHTQNAGGIPYYAGRVTFETAPLNFFILARGIFSDAQWLVPYAGGGWTRMFYREEIQHQGVSRGYTDGYHARGGIQLLLDVLDPGAANNLFLDYGVHHTYFFLETRYTRAMIGTADTSSRSVNLGGTSLLAGFLFEF